MLGTSFYNIHFIVMSHWKLLWMKLINLPCHLNVLHNIFSVFVVYYWNLIAQNEMWGNGTNGFFLYKCRHFNKKDSRLRSVWTNIDRITFLWGNRNTTNVNTHCMLITSELYPQWCTFYVLLMADIIYVNWTKVDEYNWAMNTVYRIDRIDRSY